LTRSRVEEIGGAAEFRRRHRRPDPLALQCNIG